MDGEKSKCFHTHAGYTETVNYFCFRGDSTKDGRGASAKRLAIAKIVWLSVLPGRLSGMIRYGRSHYIYFGSGIFRGPGQSRIRLVEKGGEDQEFRILTVNSNVLYAGPRTVSVLLVRYVSGVFFGYVPLLRFYFYTYSSSLFSSTLYLSFAPCFTAVIIWLSYLYSSSPIHPYLA